MLDSSRWVLQGLQQGGGESPLQLSEFLGVLGLGVHVIKAGQHLYQQLLCGVANFLFKKARKGQHLGEQTGILLVSLNCLQLISIQLMSHDSAQKYWKGE